MIVLVLYQPFPSRASVLTHAPVVFTCHVQSYRKWLSGIPSPGILPYAGLIGKLAMYSDSVGSLIHIELDSDDFAIFEIAAADSASYRCSTYVMYILYTHTAKLWTSGRNWDPANCLN